MDNYNFRSNNINVNTNVNKTTNITDNNTDVFPPPFSKLAAGAEVKPIIFPQHQQEFRKRTNDDNISNEPSLDNGKSFESSNNNDNDIQKRPAALSESDILINTNKKRLSVDYILT